eukprot:3972280-Ditylum_brightwellii.AAC.1
MLSVQPSAFSRSPSAHQTAQPTSAPAATIAAPDLLLTLLMQQQFTTLAAAIQSNQSTDVALPPTTPASVPITAHDVATIVAVVSASTPSPTSLFHHVLDPTAPSGMTLSLTRSRPALPLSIAGPYLIQYHTGSSCSPCGCWRQIHHDSVLHDLGYPLLVLPSSAPTVQYINLNIHGM